MKQDVVFGTKALQEIFKGASILAEAVMSTMGPSGHNVIIQREKGSPLITKDGVTVARSINLREKLPSLGAELLKEVASKTNELVGDGPQPLYAKVLTPTGWKSMGDIKVGDRICGTNNSIQRVLGVFKKGKKEIYKVAFAEGNKQTRFVECCKEHLWAVKTQAGKPKLLTTKQLFDSGLQHKNNGGKYFISQTSVEFDDNAKQLPLDSYLLGVLLGDGSLSIKHEVEIAIGLGENYVLDNLILPEGCKLRKRLYAKKHYIKASITGSNRKNTPRGEPSSIIKNILKDLKLLGTDSHTKFIPKQYLYSSIETRQRLLDGLIDTDGTVGKRGLFSFSTVSKQLYEDFIELCRSLGKPIYCEQKIRKPNKGSYSTKPIYRVSELKGNKYGFKICSIEKTNQQTEMMCIKVSNDDHLYITNDFIPTHNTTCSSTLAHSIFQNGLKMISSGHSAIDIKKGMDLATTAIIQTLKSRAIPIREGKEDIENIGTISANGDREIGKLLAEAISKVGSDGIITVEPAKSFKTTMDLVEGMQFDGGYISPYFITNQEKNLVEFQDPFILITNRKISSLQEIVPLLEEVANQNKPLLIIGDEIEGEALHLLITNKIKNVLSVCAIKAPSYGENRTDILHDIALLTEGTVMDASNPNGLKNVTLSDLGKCKKIIISRQTTTIVGNQNEEIKEKIQERVATLRHALSYDPTMDLLKLNNYKKRIAKLAGGIAIIKVGGSTEVEIFEKKDRVDDALNATIAAVKEGIIPGGGTALFYAACDLETSLKTKDISPDIKAGYMVICNACKTPLETIVQNTGKNSGVVMDKLISFQDTRLFDNQEDKDKMRVRYGYDASQHRYGDLVEWGIIDPVLMARCALEHAASVIGLLLTSKAVIVNEPDNKEETSQQ
jgi:chaperonin GroEL